MPVRNRHRYGERDAKVVREESGFIKRGTRQNDRNFGRRGGFNGKRAVNRASDCLSKTALCEGR